MATKTKIKLKEEQINLLSNLSEQGMGYQIVDIHLKDGTELKEKIVFNSTFLQLENDEGIEPDEIEIIKLHEE